MPQFCFGDASGLVFFEGKSLKSAPGQIVAGSGEALGQIIGDFDVQGQGRSLFLV